MPPDRSAHGNEQSLWFAAPFRSQHASVDGIKASYAAMMTASRPDMGCWQSRDTLEEAQLVRQEQSLLQSFALAQCDQGLTHWSEIPLRPAKLKSVE